MAQVPGSPDPALNRSRHAWSNDISSEALSALETYKQKDQNKVVVRFKAVGNAPIMKQNFYKITSSNRFQTVIQFLRKELGWKQGDPLFTYINLAFSPAPDDTVLNLYKSFQTEGHLIVNYSGMGLKPNTLMDGGVTAVLLAISCQVHKSQSQVLTSS